MFISIAIFLSANIKLILLTIILVIFNIIYSKRKTAVCINKIPSTKLKFWHLLGHARLSINHLLRRTNTKHCFDVYEFQWNNGFVELFLHTGICALWHVNKPTVLVFRADTVKAILSHSSALRKAWFYKLFHSWIGTGLLTSDDEKWKQRRKMLTPTFHFDILKDFIPGINNQSQILVKLLQNEVDKPWVNIVPYVTRCSLDIICETTLGVKINSQTASESAYVKAVISLSEKIVTRAHSPWYWSDKLFQLLPLGKECFKNIDTVHGFTRKVIAQRKLEMEKKMRNYETEKSEENVFRYGNRKALLEFMLEDHLKHGTITEEGIREEIDTFTFEGHDTTSMGMSWAIYLIGLYPEVQKKLHEELYFIFGDDKEQPINTSDLSDMKYLECIIKEAQRLYPSVPFFARELDDDIEIQGYVVPKGTTCGICSYTLHRDSKVFPNAEEFDPDRFLPENSEGRDAFAYIPFSAGARNCIGQRFAMMEVKMVLATLFRNFRVQSLDQRDQVFAVNNVVLRPENGIRIKLFKKTF